MNKEELMFKIAQLRQEKMTYAMDSIMVTLFGTLLIFGLGFVFPLVDPYVVIKWIVVVCAVWFVFVTLGNIVRFLMIRKLEKQLYDAGSKTESKRVTKKKVSKKK